MFPALQRLGAALVLAMAFAAAGSEEVRLEAGRFPMRMRTWTTDDGLPQHEIHCLKQTRDGYLWIGTFYGLARFDGMRFQSFDKFNTPEMPNDTINALAEDQDGALWIGTGSGLLRYQAGRFRRFIIGDGRNDPQVWRVAASSRGGVWLQAGPNVLHFQAGAFSTVLDSRTMPFGDIINLQEGEGGRLNIITHSAWLELGDDRLLRTNGLRASSAPAWFTARLGKNPAECWVGFDDGASLLRRAGLMQRVPQVVSSRVDFVQEDLSGNLWLNASSPMLYLREGDKWQAVDLGSQSVGRMTCLEHDSEGSTWLGTLNGLVRVRSAPARSYTRRDGLSDNNVWSVCEGSDGTIWVGTQQGLSAIVPEGQVRNWRESEPRLDYTDRCVWPNRAGGVFLTKQDDGVYEFQDGRFNKRFPQDSLRGLPTGLWEDSQGRLVLATSASVSFLRGVESDSVMFEDASYPVPDARAMVEDRDGTVWLATKGSGVARIKKGLLSFLRERDGLSNSNVWTIHRDADDSLWMATDNGLTRWKHGKPSVVTRRHGLLENTVNCVLQDDQGYFWLSGLHGIYRIAGAQLRAVADGRAATLQVHAIGTADGMESPETNGETQPSGCKARDGRLWFPTIRGVVVIDPQKINLRETPPKVVFEEIKANGMVMPNEWWSDQAPEARSVGRRPSFARPTEGRPHRLEAGQGRLLEFKYTVNTFMAPERVKFRFRLQGAEVDWREETGSRTVSYPNLRPGNYRFEVKAGNHHNLWSQVPSVFEFSVAPEFWQSWPFYILCGAAVVGMAAAVQAYRLRWERRLLNIEQQKALAVERTRIARDLHDDLGTALTGLALELDVIGRDPGAPNRLSARLSETAGKARSLAERMREVVWTVNPRCDTVASLADFLEQQATQFLRASEVMVRLEFPEDIPPLPIGAEARHQLALSVREALNNIVRHAAATEVVLGLSIADGILTVQIRDNGKGFRPSASPGHGLENMRARLEQAGGAFEIASKPGAGAVLNFRLPIDKSARAATNSASEAARSLPEKPSP